jgi:plasmid stability protein
MHRTQVILEDWQYQALRARAEQEGRSISDLVRETLRSSLAQPPERNNRLREIEGVGEDASTYGEDHDRFLYGDRDGG